MKAVRAMSMPGLGKWFWEWKCLKLFYNFSAFAAAMENEKGMVFGNPSFGARVFECESRPRFEK
jgi:hypothetical protein